MVAVKKMVQVLKITACILTYNQRYQNIEDTVINNLNDVKEQLFHKLG